jgi:leucyl aminopeptidase
MTAVFEDDSSPERRDLLRVAVAARVPAGAEVVGVLVTPETTSVKVPGGSSVSSAALARRGFEAKAGQTVVVSTSAERVVLAVGCAPAPEVPASEAVRRGAAALVRQAGRARSVAVVLGGPTTGVNPPDAAQAIAEGAALATYRYQGFKSAPEPDGPVGELTLVTGPDPRIQRALQRGVAIASAVAMVRDLVNEPPGSLTPSRFAAIAQRTASTRGLSARVYDLAAIQSEGLGGLGGVARGSEQEPRMVRLEYQPRARARAKVALVGKGITFDSGGLSLKTGEGMMTMKDDMAGAAVVLGAMSLLAELRVPVHVVGFMPLTENMPGGRAIKPGDVLRARNGKTMEVLNTDAEGRLVLADGLSLAAEEKPDAIIDLATLTGAVVTALGRKIAGLMGNDERLSQMVQSAGAVAGERYWPLPLPADYRRDIDSQVADMKNIGNAGQAGSIIAGLFLQEFVGGLPWAHLDIAGTAWGEADSAYLSRGATGFGVRTLAELLSRWPSGADRATSPARVGTRPKAAKAARSAPAVKAARANGKGPVKIARTNGKAAGRAARISRPAKPAKPVKSAAKKAAKKR